MPSAHPLTLTIPSDLRLLPVVRSFVEAVAQLGDLETKATNDIVLATNEAVSNVIRHAHSNQPDTIVQIQCSLLQDGIEISLLDQGAPFDVACVPYLDPAEERPGGRGVFLMRALVDALICCPRATGGNTLRLIKRRRSSASLSEDA